MMPKPLSAIVISVTPFDHQGKLDELAFRQHLRRLSAAGVTTYVAGSGTSEGYALSPDERDRVLAISVEELKGKSPVRSMGCEPRLISEMVDYLKAAERAGVDAAHIFPLDMGHGAKPTVPEMERYYCTAIESTSLPVIISSHHAVGYLIPLDLLQRLVERYSSVIGVVFADHDLRYLTDLMQRIGHRVEVHCGGPLNSLNVLGLGGTGFMGHEGNVAPKLVASLLKAFRAGDIPALQSAYKKLLALSLIIARSGGSAGRGLKPLMNALELNGGTLRAPRIAISEAEAKKMVDEVRELQIPELSPA